MVAIPKLQADKLLGCCFVAAGFSLEEPDDHTIELKFKGRPVALNEQRIRFTHYVRVEELQNACARYLHEIGFPGYDEKGGY